MAQALCFTLAAVRLETTASAFFDTQSLQKILWIANTAKAGALMKEGLRLFQQTPMFPDLPETKLEHIIDTIYFGDSKESRGLQLADACNFVIKRRLMKHGAIDPYCRLIEPQIFGKQDGIMYDESAQ